MLYAHACTPRHVSLTIVTRTITLPQSRLGCYRDLNVGEWWGTDGCCAVAVWLPIIVCEISGRRRYVWSIVNLYPKSF